MKTWLLHGYESSKLWVRIILALGTNHLNFGYESSGYETSVGTKRPVSFKDINIRALLINDIIICYLFCSVTPEAFTKI